MNIEATWFILSVNLVSFVGKFLLMFLTYLIDDILKRLLNIIIFVVEINSFKKDYNKGMNIYSLLSKKVLPVFGMSHLI